MVAKGQVAGRVTGPTARALSSAAVLGPTVVCQEPFQWNEPGNSTLLF